MTAIANAPDEVFYHIAKQPQTVDALIHSLYRHPAPLTVDHFKAINSHLKDGRVQAGQLIIITPQNSQQCSRFEADMMEAAALVDKQLAALSGEERRILAENYQLLSNVASVGGVGYGTTLIYFAHHVKNLEGILKQIEQLYIQTYNKTSKLNSPKFYEMRKQLFTRLDMTMRTFVGHARMGFTLDHASIKNSLGLNTKSILHQWKRQPRPVTNIDSFATNYAKAGNLSKTLRGAGYVGIALDVGHSGVKIHEACTLGTEQQCTKTSYAEGGRLGGSVLGGSFGGIGVGRMLFAI